MSRTAERQKQRSKPATAWSIFLPGLLLLVVLLGAAAGAGGWFRPSHHGAASASANFQPAIHHEVKAPSAAPPGMVWIPPGSFWMGSDYPRPDMDDARPIHPVALDGFWIDQTPVTNEQYAAFVDATHYVTVAERKLDPKEFPGVPTDKLAPGSCCFAPPKQAVSLENHMVWWNWVTGADWRHPEGPASDLKGREQHPVVQVAFEDAQAYATWAGKRLPTEAEFEYAARGGLDRATYSWGNEFRPAGKLVANTFQGHFPDQNTAEDGYVGTSPVNAFPPNGFGLYDMGGNVWQWCADWYRADYYKTLPPGAVVKNPQGPTESDDPREPGIKKRVLRSGSFLCTEQYCVRFLVGSRGRGAIDSGTSNIGFRCAKGR